MLVKMQNLKPTPHLPNQNLDFYQDPPMSHMHINIGEAAFPGKGAVGDDVLRVEGRVKTTDVHSNAIVT